MSTAHDAQHLQTVDPVSHLVLSPHPRAVRDARAFVQDRCRAGGVADDACDAAVLLTSEIVTNAFVHGRSDARITVTLGDGTLVVEVGDDNAQLPQVVEQRAESVGGRGLFILDGMASSWGTVEHPEGKTVWFELLLSPPVESLPVPGPAEQDRTD